MTDIVLIMERSPWGPTLDDISAKLALFEARLTLLERKFSHLAAAGEIVEEQPVGPVVFSCNDPSLLISQVHPTEQDEDGTNFCWVGNEGPIQFVLPVKPSRPLTCVLRLLPYPSVSFAGMVIQVNDEVQPVEITHPTQQRMMEVSFPVTPSDAPNLNILLLGVESVRPSDFGENADTRHLAARFFGAAVVFS